MTHFPPNILLISCSAVPAVLPRSEADTASAALSHIRKTHLQEDVNKRCNTRYQRELPKERAMKSTHESTKLIPRKAEKVRWQGVSTGSRLHTLLLWKMPFSWCWQIWLPNYKCYETLQVSNSAPEGCFLGAREQGTARTPWLSAAERARTKNRATNSPQHFWGMLNWDPVSTEMEPGTGSTVVQLGIDCNVAEPKWDLRF